MSILDKIIAQKRSEVEEKKSLVPVKLLEKSIYFDTKPLSMKHYLLREDKVGIIAEFKRRSPSEGMINEHAKVEKTTIGYMQAGASALSVLTDTEFFGGKNEDILLARKYNFCPIIRKDFILEEYQILETKSLGADTVLLIASALTPEVVKRLSGFTKSLGMEVLLEVHNEEELKAYLNDDVDMLGVNNRNLGTFETAIQTSIELANQIPDQFVKVSESGIKSPETILELKGYGYKGFLMGTHFMKYSRPEKACADFIHRLKEIAVVQ